MDDHDRELLKQEIKQEILKAIDENTPTTAWGGAFKQGFSSA